MNELSASNKRIFYILLTTLGVYFSFRYLLGFFFPFLMAWVLAGMLIRLRNGLQHLYRTSRKTGNLLTGIFILFTAGGLLSCLLLTIYKRTRDLVHNYDRYIHFLSKQANVLCTYCDKTLHLNGGSTRKFMDEQLVTLVDRNAASGQFTSNSLSYLRNAAHFVMLFFIILLATFLLLKDRNIILQQYHQSVFYTKTSHIMDSLRLTVFAWLKAECIIMLIISALCTLTLTFTKAPYPLFIGIGIGLIDALPVLGSGIILVPWTIYHILSGQTLYACALLATYILCVLTRQFLEAKLIGKEMGLLPFYMLLSMYVGLRLFGIFGFLLGPGALLIITTVAKEICCDEKQRTNLTH